MFSPEFVRMCQEACISDRETLEWDLKHGSPLQKWKARMILEIGMGKLVGYPR